MSRDTRNGRAPFWSVPLLALFDSLGAGGPPGPADCIFVFEGRPERKPYGLTLWKRGLAPLLVLSVGRFEWRRFVELGLPDDGGLVDLVQRTNPEDRHFFVALSGTRAHAERVDVHGLGTWNEARALAAFLRREGLRSVLIVSTSMHLRRAAGIRRRHLRGSGIEVHATPVPESQSTIARETWWRDAKARRAVLREAAKLALYRLRMALP